MRRVFPMLTRLLATGLALLLLSGACSPGETFDPEMDSAYIDLPASHNQQIVDSRLGFASTGWEQSIAFRIEQSSDAFLTGWVHEGFYSPLTGQIIIRNVGDNSSHEYLLEIQDDTVRYFEGSTWSEAPYQDIVSNAQHLTQSIDATIAIEWQPELDDLVAHIPASETAVTSAKATMQADGSAVIVERQWNDLGELVQEYAHFSSGVSRPSEMTVSYQPLGAAASDAIVAVGETRGWQNSDIRAPQDESSVGASSSPFDPAGLAQFVVLHFQARNSGSPEISLASRMMAAASSGASIQQPRPAGPIDPQRLVGPTPNPSPSQEANTPETASEDSCQSSGGGFAGLGQAIECAAREAADELDGTGQLLGKPTSKDLTNNPCPGQTDPGTVSNAVPKMSGGTWRNDAKKLANCIRHRFNGLTKIGGPAKRCTKTGSHSSKFVAYKATNGSCKGAGRPSDHVSGKALDAFVTPVDPKTNLPERQTKPWPAGSAELAAGDAVKDWAVNNQSGLGIDNVIWNGTIYNSGNGWQGKPFTGSSRHYDHVHIDYK